MAGALVTTNILQTVVSMALSALRERIILARIANREREGDIIGATRNATVNIVIPAAVTASDVAPDVVPAAVTPGTPTTIPLTLNKWKYAPFVLDDKGLAQVKRDIIPQQLTEAVKAIVNAIELDLWSLLTGGSGFYGYVGTAGTTPFSTGLDEFTAANTQADIQLMPMDPDRRFVIMDPYAKGNALNLPAIQNAQFRGSDDAYRSGIIGHVLGANWDMSQHVPRHTAGTITTGLIAKAATVVALGVKTVVATTAASTGAAALLAGDIITFGTDPQTYVLTADATQAVAATDVTLAIEPGLKVALAGSEAITVKASHRMNLLIHGDGIAFAMAPLAEQTQVEGLQRAQAVAIDNDSGLALRLKVTEQHYQVQWALDALWGRAMVRREYGVRIAG